jgi:large subunit ribosomal protein L14e
MKVGEICVKVAGRDAGGVCVVVAVEKDGFVTIDGATRRRKCNPLHLEVLGKTVKIKSGATRAEVIKALNAEGYNVSDKVTKKKEAKVRIVRKRVQKSAEKTAKNAEKKTVKKAAKKKVVKKKAAK